jgi:hypothetical protein
MGFVWKYRDGKNWYNAYNRSLGLRRKSLKTFIVGEAVGRVEMYIEPNRYQDISTFLLL